MHEICRKHFCATFGDLNEYEITLFDELIKKTNDILKGHNFFLSLHMSIRRILMN